MENRVKRFCVRTRDKTEDGALMPRPPYMVGISADLLAETSAVQFGVYEHIYTMTDAVLAEMARQISHVKGVTPRDSAVKTFSIYLREIGLPPFRKLDGLYAVIELRDEADPDGRTIDVTSGAEPFICSGSAPLIPRYHI